MKKIKFLPIAGIIISSVSLTLLSLPTVALADEETVGDFFAIALPLGAYTSTWALDDKKGRSQYYKSFVVTSGLNAALKLSGISKRPHNSKHDSFPSGHTAYAFQGATYINKRYGSSYGIPAYFAATYVAYTRRKKHHNIDIFSGALIGIASSNYYTTHRETDQQQGIQPMIVDNGIGFSYSNSWY